MRAAPSVSLRPIALPNEHAWGFLLEPALPGLLLAPTGAGAPLAVAATFGLLAQHPLRLERGEATPTLPTLLAHGLALAPAALLVALVAVGYGLAG